VAISSSTAESSTAQTKEYRPLCDQKLFRSAYFHPDDLVSLRDIRKIPITTKQDLRDNHSEMLRPGANLSRCGICHTSGSTGIPLNIVRDRKTLDYSFALKLYAFLECGMRITDRFVTVARTDASSWPPRWVLTAAAEPDAIIQSLREIKPDVLYTYANALSSIAACDVSGIQPKLIFCQGIKLTQHCRDLVKSAFGRNVFDTYGSAEFSRLAFECPAHGCLHMITDCAVMEFVIDGEPVPVGTSGEIVVTALYNHTMPLIRYNLEDVGVQTDETCSCWRTWPLIKSIEGRHVDFFTMPSGKKFNPGFFYYGIFGETRRNISSIAQFQIVQLKRDRIAIRIVRGKEFDPEMVDRLRKVFEKSFLEMEEPVSVEVLLVDEIPRESSGKIKTMVSLVD